jgi:SAM-dependent methyltransferase
MESGLRRGATNAPAHVSRRKTNEAYGKHIFDQVVLSLLDVQPGEAVLDLGCGNGKFLIPLAEAAGPEGTAVGLDIDQVSLADAESRANGARVNLNLMVGSMDDLGSLVSGYTFDAACCSYALYYASDPETTLNQMIDLMRENGRILVTGPRPGNNGELFDLLRKAGMPGTPALDPGFMADVVDATCRRRFEHVHEIPLENPVTFPTAEAVVRYWESSAYYDTNGAEKLTAVLTRHFAENQDFTITKRGAAILAHSPRRSTNGRR